jgi:60 kDa SS-A/Ro ribonucleoprotein
MSAFSNFFGFSSAVAATTTTPPATTTPPPPTTHTTAPTTTTPTGPFKFKVNDLDSLKRFLVLGSGASKYTAGKSTKPTMADVTSLVQLLSSDGLMVVALLEQYSMEGRCVRQDPLLFALAVTCRLGDQVTKTAAYDAVPKMCGIPTNLFMWLGFMTVIDGPEKGRGFGRGTRRAVFAWYTKASAKQTAYQCTKFANREGFSHRDVARLVHPKTTNAGLSFLFSYLVKGAEVLEGGCVGESDVQEVHEFLTAVEKAKMCVDEDEMVMLIDRYNLAREHIPTPLLNSVVVWRALVQKMPITATLRNLGKMSSIGLLTTDSSSIDIVVARLTSEDQLTKGKIHPLNILNTLNQYRIGHGDLGSLSWPVVPQLVQALNDAFYLAFKTLIPSGKRFLLGLDVSGSMGASIAGMNMSCAMASSAMAMVLVRTEPWVKTMAFSRGFVPLDLLTTDTLETVLTKTSGLPFESTDCAQPMLYALRNKLAVDTFVIFTDSETNVGSISAKGALEQYRTNTGIPAKVIVVGMTSSGFTIADPEDAGMLDVVGFDTAAPGLMADFARY